MVRMHRVPQGGQGSRGWSRHWNAELRADKLEMCPSATRRLRMTRRKERFILIMCRCWGCAVGKLAPSRCWSSGSTFGNRDSGLA